jgi:hypothetical protein
MITNRREHREDWLHRATLELREKFDKAEIPLPAKLHLSVGFPAKGALARRKRRIGECWAPSVSADGVHHIFISPLLGDPIEVLATLVHELLHAAVGVEHAHKGQFISGMKKVGLVGKPTATEAGEALRAELVELVEVLGTYPHAALDPKQLERKKQTTRMLKATCPNGDSVGGKVYTVRMTRLHIEAFGAPVCPKCGEQMRVDGMPKTEDADEDREEDTAA